MSEIPQAPSPKKEILTPRRESIAEEFADDSPIAERNYGDARLWLTARDPRSLFAYWDFRPGEHPVAVGADGRAQFFLRSYRDGNAESTVEIESGTGHAFIPAQSPDSGYSAELGFFADGIWCFVARSGIARTPPELFASDEEVVFATIPANVSLGKMSAALAPFTLPGEGLARTVARIQNAAREQGEWTPAHQILLAIILGESAEDAAPGTLGDLALTLRIHWKLEAAAKAAASFPPLAAPEGGMNAPSSSPGWIARPDNA